MAVYDEEMTVFTGECKKSRESIIEAGNHLKDALEQVYSVDVIFPKYRNLVAVTTIYEYLASGRCDTLEGADGAYNLYEMELRQNIIIGQLSSVLDSLEQIKNSQFTLYSELEESNRKSADLLSNISDNVEFSRYASEEIAKSNKLWKEIQRPQSIIPCSMPQRESEAQAPMQQESRSDPVAGGRSHFSNLQHQMPLNGFFNLLLLDADISLCHGGGRMLEELLNKGNIIAAVLVNFCGIEFAETVGGDALIA